MVFLTLEQVCDLQTPPCESGFCHQRCVGSKREIRHVSLVLSEPRWRCSGPRSLRQQLPPGTIKIGVNQPLTGRSPRPATSSRTAPDRRRRDQQEGGVLGQKLELVIEDNKSNPTEAVAAAEKLIVRDKVPVMMGAWSSTYTLAVMPKLMEYKVPMLVETSSSDKITISGNPYVFRISPTSGMEADAFARPRRRAQDQEGRLPRRQQRLGQRRRRRLREDAEEGKASRSASSRRWTPRRRT